MVPTARGFLASEPRASPTWHERIAHVAAKTEVREASRQLTRDRKWLNQQHVALCRVPAPTFRETERAEHLREVIAGLGHRPQIDPAGNVVVPIVYSSSLPYLAVTAHMDTILAPSRPEDIRVEPDGTMHGPGVTDNGTGLTAILALSKLLGNPLVEKPSRNLLLVANVAEEGEGNLRGMRYVAEHSPYASCIDRYVVLDGASLSHITTSALGSKRFELVIQGRGGHSWNDYGRANPVHAMARAISLMTNAKLPSNPRTTLSVGMVQGGTSVNSIPCAARTKIDVRSTDESEIARTAKIVEESLRLAVQAENSKATDRLVAFAMREIGSRPASGGLDSNPVSDCFQAVDSYLRIPSSLDLASTDANIPLAAGVPTVAIGSGGRGGEAHSPGEWYDPHGRDLGLRRLVIGIAGIQSWH